MYPSTHHDKFHAHLKYVMEMNLFQIATPNGIVYTGELEYTEALIEAIRPIITEYYPHQICYDR